MLKPVGDIVFTFLPVVQFGRVPEPWHNMSHSVFETLQIKPTPCGKTRVGKPSNKRRQHIAKVQRAVEVFNES
jgi:hypothetical protein